MATKIKVKRINTDYCSKTVQEAYSNKEYKDAILDFLNRDPIERYVAKSSEDINVFGYTNMATFIGYIVDFNEDLTEFTVCILNDDYVDSVKNRTLGFSGIGSNTDKKYKIISAFFTDKKEEQNGTN